MTTEVEWVLDTIKTHWNGEYPDDLIRVNRDNSEIIDEYSGSTVDAEIGDDVGGPPHTRLGDLSDGNFVGASSDPLTSFSPIGFGYDHEVEAGVGVRVEGLHHDEWGHTSSQAEFANLVNSIQRALLSQRSYPFGNYHSLFIRESDSQSANHKDYYRQDFDVWFVGYDELP